MPDVRTIETGVINDDTGVLLSIPSPYPPYRKGVVEYCEELVMGDAAAVLAGTAQFVSGDSLVFKFEGSTKILHISITNNVGAVIPYTEAAIGGGVTGQKVTTGAVTTNVKARIIADC